MIGWHRILSNTKNIEDEAVSRIIIRADIQGGRSPGVRVQGELSCYTYFKDWWSESSRRFYLRLSPSLNHLHHLTIDVVYDQQNSYGHSESPFLAFEKNHPVATYSKIYIRIRLSYRIKPRYLGYASGSLYKLLSFMDGRLPKRL